MFLTAVRTLTSALAAPGLSSSISGSTATLNWTAPTPTGQSVIAGYRVLKSSTLGGTYTQVGATLPPTTLTLTDTLSGTQFYKVEAFDQYSPGNRSPGLQCAPVVTGGRIKHKPSVFYITFDHNTSMATALSLTKQIKAAYPGLAGIEKFTYPAIWENPNLVGGNAQYDGSWATGDQTDINQLRGGRLMQRWLDECAALGITFAAHDFSAWGGVSAAGTQSATSFPGGFAPAYWSSTNYGTVSPATNGLWGAIWANCYTPNGVRFGYYVRYWDSRVMALYISRAQYYGANFDSNSALKQMSFWDESSIPAVPGYSESAAMGTLFGPNGFFVKARAAFPTTQLRYYLNYVSNGGNGLANLDLYFPALSASYWSIGGPDMTNEVVSPSGSPGGSSWNQFRSIDADFRYLGYNSAIPNGGTPQAGVTNYFGQLHQSRIVEPEDLTFDNNPQPSPNQNLPVGAVPSGQRYLGDGSMYHIVQQANRLGVTDIYWMYQTFVGPSRNRFNPVSHPNALDWIASCAQGGNVAVNGVTAGIALTNTAYPSTWPQNVPTQVANLELVQQGGTNNASAPSTASNKHSWTAVSGATGYKRYRSKNGAAQTVVDLGNVLVDTDTTCTNNNDPNYQAFLDTYAYQYSAYNANGESAKVSPAVYFMRNGVSKCGQGALSFGVPPASENWAGTLGGRTCYLFTFAGGGGGQPVSGPGLCGIWDLNLNPGYSAMVIDVCPGPTVVTPNLLINMAASRIPNPAGGDAFSRQNGVNIFDGTGTYGPNPQPNTWGTYTIPFTTLQLGTGTFTASIINGVLNVTSLGTCPNIICGGGRITGPSVPANTIIVSSNQNNSIGTHVLYGPGITGSTNVPSGTYTFQRFNMYKLSFIVPVATNWSIGFDNFGFV